MFGREVGAFVSEAVEDTSVDSMPEAAKRDRRIILVFSFDTEAQREQLVELIGAERVKKRNLEWSTWYPPGSEPDTPQGELF